METFSGSSESRSRGAIDGRGRWPLIGVEVEDAIKEVGDDRGCEPHAERVVARSCVTRAREGTRGKKRVVAVIGPKFL